MEKHVSHTYPVVIEADPGGGFLVSNPAIPGCYNQGDSIEEALANIKEATLLCLEELQVSDGDVPQPNSVSLHLITT